MYVHIRTNFVVFLNFLCWEGLGCELKALLINTLMPGTKRISSEYACLYRLMVDSDLADHVVT
jgi:hypothetical protein